MPNMDEKVLTTLYVDMVSILECTSPIQDCYTNIGIQNLDIYSLWSMMLIIEQADEIWT